MILCMMMCLMFNVPVKLIIPPAHSLVLHLLPAALPDIVYSGSVNLQLRVTHPHSGFSSETLEPSSMGPRVLTAGTGLLPHS